MISKYDEQRARQAKIMLDTRASQMRPWVKSLYEETLIEGLRDVTIELIEPGDGNGTDPKPD